MVTSKESKINTALAHPQCNHAKGQSSREGIRLPILSELHLRAGLPTNLPQHHLHHVPIARGQVEEANTHHGCCLYGVGDLHVCSPHREERREVDGQQAHQGGGHTASTSGGRRSVVKVG